MWAELWLTTAMNSGGMLPSSWPVGELFDWEIAPLTFRFSDPDGNRLYVSEES